MLKYSLLLSLLVIFILVWLWRRRLFYKLSWQLPGPIAFPIIGNALMVLNMNENMRRLDDMCKQYPSPMRFWGGTDLYVIAHDAEDIQTILKSSNCLNRLNIYKYIKEGISPLGDGLFTSSGSEWKLHRRLVGQSFGLSTMYNNIPVFNKHIHTLLKTLNKKVGKAEFDVRLMINQVTINMFLESTLGTDITSEDKKRYTRYLTQGQQILSKRLFQPWYQVDWIWNLSGYRALMDKYTAFAAKIIDGIVVVKLSAKTGDFTFIDRLLHISEENDNFSLNDVKVETTTLLMGASDTTAVTIAFTVLMLAMHPECQERCFEELKTIIPNRETAITSAHLEQLSYTEQCIQETLRLFPTVSVIGRCPDKEIQLKNFTLPPGVSVILGIRQLMRRKEYWGDDVDQYNPDHCLPERLQQLPDGAYIPFSDGPRICVAYKYAMVVIKTMIIQLFRNYRYTTSLKLSELKIRSDVNSRLLNNHMVKIYRRID